MKISIAESGKRNAAFIGDPAQIDRVYAQGRKEQIGEMTNLFPHVVTRENFDSLASHLENIEVLFSTWGMPSLSGEQIDKLPNLKAVFYGAGSVQGFARDYLKRDVLVMSAWGANAVPVAEWTLAQIILANKGYFRHEREFRIRRDRKGTYMGRGNFGATVSILGAGQIGRLLIQLLKPFHLQICVFDPFLSMKGAHELGVEKVELLEAFERGTIVSNHLANLPETVGMLQKSHFSALPLNATFINTGRGATVRENEMIEVMSARPDLTALLDVTYPEPPVADSPLWDMENVFLTAHLAGAMGDEVIRLADYCIEEFSRWQNGEKLRYGVTLEMLETMA
jgi:phosphoglycerate dehydrogenase-like enzyme